MTQEFPNLSRAPVHEALVDFRVRSRGNLKAERLADLADSFVADYPRRDPIHRFHGQISFDDQDAVSEQPNKELYGQRITSADGLNVAQLRIDGFTFSRLAPYESWHGMVNSAWHVWERYFRELRPKGVGRVATRFINVLTIARMRPLDHLLTAPPLLPPGLPATCSAFLFRYVTEATDGIASTVSLATESGSHPESVGLVLDIDCYANREFSVKDGDMLEIKETLERLRERKNTIFFRSIRPEILEDWR
ncbi:MAG: TIGR04255 family protein [Gemmatimonadetes bacterium]|nr:TIGR04255 family protein [Gemmatimonadota bacterium]